MAGKKSIIIAAIAALVNGCALDDIAEKPTCTTSHDFSQQEETAYATEAAENLHQVCPDVTENIQFCYQNLKSPNNYLCTICSREQFFCNGECIDMPCTIAQCHYADDLVENAPPRVSGPAPRKHLLLERGAQISLLLQPRQPEIRLPLYAMRQSIRNAALLRQNRLLRGHVLRRLRQSPCRA